MEEKLLWKIARQILISPRVKIRERHIRCSQKVCSVKEDHKIIQCIGHGKPTRILKIAEKKTGES